MRESKCVLCLSLLFLLGCASSEPAILGSMEVDGRGHPFGHTNPSDAMPLTEVSADPTYGYSQDNPIKVGGVRDRSGSANQRQYFSALAGPEGQPITFERRGHCCPYETEHGFMGSGVLDVYMVTYDGVDEPIVLYITFYEYEEPKAPRGFTIAPR